MQRADGTLERVRLALHPNEWEYPERSQRNQELIQLLVMKCMFIFFFSANNKVISQDY